MVKITELPPTTADELTVADYLPVVIDAAGVTKKITMGELRGHIAVHADDLDSLAGSLSDVSAVATDLAAVQSVAADLTDVSAVAADLVDIKAVAADQSDIDAVAADLPDIKAAAANMADIQAAPQAATDAGNARDGAEAFRNEAETLKNQAAASAADAVANGVPSALLSKHVRAQYGILTRPPVVVIDPVTETYFGPDGPKALTDLVDHVRNSGAAFTDGDGLVQTMAADTPRVDHHILKDGMFQRAGLRVDTQATNLLKYSQDFSQSAWVKGGSISVTTASTTAPDGTATAALLTGVSGAICYVSQAVTVDSGPATFSVYARAGTEAALCFRAPGYGLTGDQAYFDLTAGTVLSSETGVDASIIDVGGGWYRCIATLTFGADLVGNIQLFLVDGDGSLTSGGGDVSVWGAQLEAGGIPTSYIKTESAQVTRAADVLTIPAANMPASNHGYTFAFEGTVDFIDDDGASSKKWLRWGQSTTPGIIQLLMENTGNFSGVMSALQNNPGSRILRGPNNHLPPGVAVPFKFAAAFTPTGMTVAINGLTTTQAHADGLPDPTASSAALLADFNGSLSKLRIFDTALPESALITETTL